MRKLCLFLILWSVLAVNAQSEVDVTQFTEMKRLGRGGLNVAVVSPDETMLAIGTSLTLELYDITEEAAQPLEIDYLFPVEDLAWSSDSIWLALQQRMDNHTFVRLFNVQENQVVAEFMLEGHRYESMVWSPDGTRVGVLAQEKIAYVLDLATQQATILENPIGRRAVLEWSLDGEHIRLTGEGAPKMTWNATTGELVGRTPQTLEGVEWAEDTSQRLTRNDIDKFGISSSQYSSAVEFLWWQDGGNTIGFYGDVNGNCGFRHYEVASGKVIHEENVCGDGPGRAYTSSPIHDWGTGPDFQTRQLNNIRISQNDAEGKALLILTGHTDEVTFTLWDSDETLLVSGSRDGTIHLWQIGFVGDELQGELLRILDADTGGVTALTWAHPYLASGSEEGVISIWDVDTGQQLVQLRGHIGAVNDLGWIYTKDQLASGGMDGTIRIWGMNE